jgi:hypothetical protein
VQLAALTSGRSRFLRDDPKQLAPMKPYAVSLVLALAFRRRL